MAASIEKNGSEIADIRIGRSRHHKVVKRLAEIIQRIIGQMARRVQGTAARDSLAGAASPASSVSV
jgi:hypothetical protein